MKQSKFLPGLLVLVSLVAFLSLSGCNTMEGVGQDVKAAGSSLEHTAAKSKSY